LQSYKNFRYECNLFENFSQHTDYQSYIFTPSFAGAPVSVDAAHPEATFFTPHPPRFDTAQSTAFLQLFYACFTVVLRFKTVKQP
jgi:hypothetical protein